ncbi:MAG: hypothetical protein V8Q57_09465 [Blautia sp.]
MEWDVQISVRQRSVPSGGDAGKPVPKSRKVVELADAVEEVESCSACYGNLIPALGPFKEEEGLLKICWKYPVFCIWQGYRQKEGFQKGYLRIGLG